MSKVVYPATAKGSVVDTYHGVEVPDPYRWLEDPDSKETEAWVSQQCAITDPYLEGCTVREAVKKRLTDLFNYERTSCPWRRGEDSVFFFHNTGLQNQNVLFKQRGMGADAKPEVLLDPNTLEEDGTASLGAYSVSETGLQFAYGVQRSGSDWQTVHVRSVSDCKDLEDRLDWVKFSSLSWRHDDHGFFYSRYPTPKTFENKEDPNWKRGTETDSNLCQAVYYHALGAPQSADILVLNHPDEPKWMTTAEVSDDGRTVLFSISESTAPVNRLYYASLEGATSMSDLKIVKLIDNFDALYEYITNDGTLFYFKTNLNAPRYRIIAIDLTKPAPSEWREVVPESEHVLEFVSAVAGDTLVLCYMEHVKHTLKLCGLDGKESKVKVTLPGIGSIIGLSGRRKDDAFFYKFSSFLYPGTIFRFDPRTGEQTVFNETKLPGFDPSPFTVEQVFYPSKDGTKVPMFLVMRKDVKRDGSNPVLLYGYGGFNISLNPDFSVARLIWLQNLGGIYAVPNLRGGGEYGEEWHKAGTLLQKQNVFDDFIGAAEFLIKEGYTQPAKIAINGGSNGGLLVAACVNQRPELFGAAVAAVGVLDMLRYSRFTIGYAWASDYGLPDDEKQFHALYRYSPLHNVSDSKPYPALLLTTASHDDRVVPLHSYKYIATVQEKLGKLGAQKAPLLIRIERKAGHGRGKPLSMQIQERADVFGFIARNLGIEWKD